MPTANELARFLAWAIEWGAEDEEVLVDGWDGRNFNRCAEDYVRWNARDDRQRRN
jgi:hypothetical protein